MDDVTAGAFANRDEPVPLLTVSYSDVDDASSEVDSDSRRQRLKKSLSPTRFRDKAGKLKDSNDGQKLSIQDRFFAKVLQQVIPSEELDRDGQPYIDQWSSDYVSRPAFSLPLMTNNFRRFNARIGIVFVFQNRMIRLLTWRTPTHTLSLLAVYTFICLDPSLLLVVPLIIALLFIMVPAFISRHPPPPETKTTSTTTPYYSTYAGPALAPAATIKPASETSKDFFRNMRDLQNSMADFTNINDFLVSTIAPATNFSNEVLASTIFLYLTLATCSLFITSHLIPWRFVLLIGGDGLIISGHPLSQRWLIKTQKRAEEHATAAMSDPSLPQNITVKGYPVPNPPAVIKSAIVAISAMTISNTLETREVEIFQLQHRPLPSSLGAENTGEWLDHMYTPMPYDPLSPSRIAGDRPKGTRFLEDVEPPEGWEWKGKMWELDLEAGEWVNDRLIVGVEYDVMTLGRDPESLTLTLTPTTSSTLQPPTTDRTTPAERRGSVNGEFGGWVWDLPPPVGTSGNRDEEVWLAYGDYEIPKPKEDEKKGLTEKTKEKIRGHKKAQPSRDWEETTTFGHGKTGEWRRRRWVRLVRRRPMSSMTNM